MVTFGTGILDGIDMLREISNDTVLARLNNFENYSS